MHLEDNLHWVADRAEALREGYQAKLKGHREALEDLARRIGWSFLVHHTDRSAAEPLLAVIMRAGAGGDGYRFQSASVPVGTG